MIRVKNSRRILVSCLYSSDRWKQVTSDQPSSAHLPCHNPPPDAADGLAHRRGGRALPPDGVPLARRRAAALRARAPRRRRREEEAKNLVLGRTLGGVP